jgi:N-acetylglucosaminyldiphosphoundecaprenol N-acetyl-beta-D-mannosaminyltransferase
MDALTRSDILAAAGRWLEGEEPRLIITVNSLMILETRKRPSDLLPLFQKASLIVPDSYGLLWASRFLKRPLPSVTPGIELVLDLCRLCVQSGRPVYLLGGRPGVAFAAGQNLQSLCPGLRVAGGHDGYFKPEEEENIVCEIRGLRPGVLFVGLGQPRQELWIGKYLDRLGTSIAMGVGGSLDVYAGWVRRAPPWLAARGLEWSYRLWQEPGRLPRILQLPRFVAAVVKEKLKYAHDR